MKLLFFPQSALLRMRKVVVRALPLPVRRALGRWLLHNRVKRSARNGARRVIVGAADTAYAGWITTDRDTLDLLRPEQWSRYFPPASLDVILAEHVWEHLSLDQGREAARTCFRYLRPGGYLRIAVPDGMHPDPAYVAAVRPGAEPSDEFGATDHQVLFTHRSLVELLESAGFRVELLEYFTEDGVFRERAWSPDGGMIVRSRRFDPRNADGRLRSTSIIADAFRP